MNTELRTIWHRYHKSIIASVIVIVVLGLYSLVDNFDTRSFNKLTPYESEMALLRCNSQLAQKITPTVTPTATPTPTLPPRPPVRNIDTLSNKLIFKNGNDIVVSDHDGKNAAITVDGAENMGYAGRVGNDTIYFYTSITASTIGVFKKNVTSGDISLLFTFSGAIEGFYRIKVQLSPNNRYFIYSNGNLYLYDIQNNTHRVLLSRKSCIPPEIGSEQCYGYTLGEWSRNGNYALVYKGFWEGGVYIAINPFENPIQERYMKKIQETIEYNSTYMSVKVGTGYGVNSIHLYTMEDMPRDIDLLADSPFKEIHSDSAETSSSGDVVFWVSDNRTIGLYSINDHTSRTLKKVSDDNYSVLAWLPDNKTILYTDDKKAVWSLDTTTKTEQKLPIQADRIYEVTP